MDRERTSRLTEPFMLVQEFDRQTRNSSAALVSAFPRPCRSSVDGSTICPDSGGLSWTDTTRHGDLRIHPLLGLEARDMNGPDVYAGDGGVQASGGIGPASFTMDARIFSEYQSSPLGSFDGEYVEHQTAGHSSSFTYDSYTRYRALLSLETPVGRISAGRESQNWGPSPFHALVLNEASVPYNQIDWTVDLGPFTIRSLVADLSIPGPGQSNTSSDTRTLFAHRYEWRTTTSVTLGISEALILYNKDAPICFLPIVPLFMQKGLWYDDINNGELSFDANWRIRPGMRVYGEFLIDDMTSPTALFNNDWKNKWASTVGTQLAFPYWQKTMPGAIIEWSRVEPWVYTHYVANTSQALNQGLPLGNPLGPNSQAVTLQAYALRKPWTFGLRGDLVWKGIDLGSQATDTLADNNNTKRYFLSKAETPGWGIGPTVAWTKGWVSATLEASILGHRQVWDRAEAIGPLPDWDARVEVRY